jgi:hypothetical protein
MKDFGEKTVPGNGRYNSPKAMRAFLNDSLHNEVWSIMNYLDDFHGFSAIQGWYAQNLDSIIQIRDADKQERFSQLEANVYMNALGLSYTKKYSGKSNNMANFTAQGQYNITKVSGYDYFLKLERYIDNGEDSKLCNFELDSLSGTLNYYLRPNGVLSFNCFGDSVVFDLDFFYKTLDAKYGETDETSIPQKEMLLQGANQQFQLRLEIQDISFEKKPSHHLKYITGYLLIKRKTGHELY